MKEHRDWVDGSNNGVSHHGIHPSLLPVDDICFDIFHMKCSATKKLMAYLRRFILNQSPEIIKDFNVKVLKNFWNHYHIHVWRNKKNFASFLGNEIALFVANTEKITGFLRENFISTNEIEDIMEGLELWEQMFKFLAITYLDNGENNYVKAIERFERSVRRFYDVGSRTFLSSSGEEETFYCHVLRFYMLPIAKKTYERHKLGLGIFSMQGFERRNKESKRCLTRTSNYRGNIVVNNVKRLWDYYKYGEN